MYFEILHAIRFLQNVYHIAVFHAQFQYIVLSTYIAIV